MKYQFRQLFLLLPSNFVSVLMCLSDLKFEFLFEFFRTAAAVNNFNIPEFPESTFNIGESAVNHHRMNSFAGSGEFEHTGSASSFPSHHLHSFSEYYYHPTFYQSFPNHHHHHHHPETEDLHRHHQHFYPPPPPSGDFQNYHHRISHHIQTPTPSYHHHYSTYF